MLIAQSLDIIQPCQVCLPSNVSFANLDKEQSRSKQAEELGLPNDGMLILVTECRQMGYATPNMVCTCLSSCPPD